MPLIRLCSQANVRRVRQPPGALLKGEPQVRNITFAAVAAAILTVAPAHAGMFVKVGDIKGGSVDRNHRDWIEATSVSEWVGVANNPHPESSGTPSYKTEVGDISFSKPFDAASVKLRDAATKQSVIPTAVIRLVKDGEGQRPHYEITLKNVRVVSVSASFDSDGASEQVSLAFDEIIWSSRVPDERGGLGAEITARATRP